MHEVVALWLTNTPVAVTFQVRVPAYFDFFLDHFKHQNTVLLSFFKSIKKEGIFNSLETRKYLYFT